jgi:hypothetical protein
MEQGELTITSSLFDHVEANDQGGALYLSHLQADDLGDASAILTNVTFRESGISAELGSITELSGGAISLLYCGTVIIRSCLFDTTTAYSRGGAIYSFTTTVLIHDSHFKNTKCLSHPWMLGLGQGGAISCVWGRIYIDGTSYSFRDISIYIYIDAMKRFRNE